MNVGDAEADPVAAYAEAASLVLKIDLPPEYRAGIIANLAQLLELGGQILAFPLPDNTELAPIFRP